MRWGLLPPTRKLRECPWKKLYIQVLYFFHSSFEVLWVVAEIIVAFTIEPTFNSKYRNFHIV